MDLFLAWIGKVKENLIKVISKQGIKSLSVSYYTYNDIKLKLYIEITESQNFKLVCKEGRGTDEECMEAWEEIVKYNAEANSSYEYLNFLNLLKSYKRLVNEQSYIKAALLKLHMILDRELIKDINKKGYGIKLTSTEDYAKSLDAAVRKLRNLKSKITMKENEIKQFQSENKKQEGTFEKMMAQLIYYSKAHIDDNITLARYNEIMKIMKEEYKPKEK